MQIRNERTRDWPSVATLLTAAFPTDAEALLVARLRSAAKPCISLIAEEHGSIVGHILFTPVTLKSAPQLLLGLAPMAVLPARQRQGIGTALVQAGLQQCKAAGAKAVFVLGHADYYPRFGFTPAAPYGIKSVYDVPAENFMLLLLEANPEPLPQGTIHFHSEFARM